MDLFQEQARAPMLITYRAVGSTTGQLEFVGDTNNGNVAYNDFGAGDIPLTNARYTSLANGRNMVHIPFLLGPISVFHSLPQSVTGGELDLNGCLLAKIFSGAITTWDHADIKAANPNLSIPAGTEIKMVHRTSGSSSTAGVTEYINTACPASWSDYGMSAGSSINWDVVNSNNGFSAQGSDGVAAYISSTPYAIGYLDAGHGHNLGLSEIKLRNAAGNYVSTKEADIGAAGTYAVQNNIIPSDPTADFSGVNLYNLPGADTWPITMISYFYLDQNMGSKDAKTAGLLKSFIEYVLSADGQAALSTFSFTGLPTAILDYNTATIAGITWPSNMQAFTLETSTDAYNGAGEYVISAKRRSYANYERANFAADILDLQTRLAALEAIKASIPVELHGSGTTNPSKFFWQTMDLFQERTKKPAKMTYRATGSSTGMYEFVGVNNENVAYNHFGAGDIPMKSAYYTTLSNAGRTMAHFPFVLGAISFFHSVSENDGELDLNACLLAKIFSGAITTWDHPDIIAVNPNLNVPAGTKIKMVHRTAGSSSTSGTTEYLNTACQAHWGDYGMTTGSTINWDVVNSANGFAAEGSDGVSTYIADTPYAIGYLDAGHGHNLKLSEIKLRNAAGRYIDSKQADIGAAGTYAVENDVIPSNPTADFSHVNLYNLPGANTWPITMVTYMYLEQDMSKYDVETAGLLKALLTYILSSEGQTSLEGFAFTGIPSEIVAYNERTISNVLVFPAGIKEYTFENSLDAGAGASERAISLKRRSFADYERSNFADSIAAMQADDVVTDAWIKSHDSDHDCSSDDDAKTMAAAALAIAIFAVVVSIIAVFYGNVKHNQNTGADTCVPVRSSKGSDLTMNEMCKA